MVNSMSYETATTTPLSISKHLFNEYLSLFPEGKEGLALKAAKKAAKANPSTQTEVLSVSSQVASINVALLFGQSSLSPQIPAKRLQPNVESSKKIQSDAKSRTGKNICAFVGITREVSVCSQLFHTLMIY